MTTIPTRPELVSIIIPCFNAEEYVAEAIDSALGQTYQHCEIIVIDDGSTDKSLEVIKSYGNKVRWETGPNRGGNAARNRGLQVCNGEWVQFLDADDILYPEKIERQLGAVQTGEICYCDYDKCDANGSIIERNCLTISIGVQDPFLVALSGGIATPLPLHSRSGLLAIGGFREELPCAQEYDLHLRLSCVGWKFRKLGFPGVVVRKLPGSVSSDFSRVLLQMLNIIEGIVKRLDELGQLDSERKEALAGHLVNAAHFLHKFGDRRMARAYREHAQIIHQIRGVPMFQAGWRSWVAIFFGQTAIGEVARLKQVFDLTFGRVSL